MRTYGYIKVKDSCLLQRPAFCEISKEELPDLVRAIGEKVVPARTIIFRQGDPCDSYYIMNAGKVRVFRKGRKGVEIDLAQLGPGEGFALIESRATRSRPMLWAALRVGNSVNK